MILYYKIFEQKLKNFEFEEDFEEESQYDRNFKVGDYITIDNLPPEHKSWITSKKEDERTFRLIREPSNWNGKLLWSTSGPERTTEPGYWGVPVGCFRHATTEEIQKYLNSTYSGFSPGGGPHF